MDKGAALVGRTGANDGGIGSCEVTRAGGFLDLGAVVLVAIEQACAEEELLATRAAEPLDGTKDVVGKGEEEVMVELDTVLVGSPGGCAPA